MTDEFSFLSDLDLAILRLSKYKFEREKIGQILLDIDRLFVSLSADQKVIALNYLLGVITNGGEE